MNAASIIEEAAEMLREKNLDVSKSIIDGVDVGSEIMNSTLAIAQATQLLMTAAAEAQQERVQQGRESNDQQRYHQDPMWAEGLISAARGVAESIRQLINFANGAADGEIDDASIIAATKSVAASTTQIQTGMGFFQKLTLQQQDPKVRGTQRHFQKWKKQHLQLWAQRNHFLILAQPTLSMN